MFIMYCDYSQTNISLYVQTYLNANGFTTKAEKVRGRSLLGCRIGLIQGHRTGTQLYEGYPITPENAKQRQAGDIYLPAYLVKGQRSTLLLDSFIVFCGNKTGSFQGQNPGASQMYPIDPHGYHLNGTVRTVTCISVNRSLPHPFRGSF